MALATDLATALDPVRLAQAAGVEPDPWQGDVLRSTGARLLLNCSRQSGKSTIVAALATHTALYQPGALVLMLSPAQRQSDELIRKALGLYSAIGRTVAPAETEGVRHLALGNGSRIVALPGKEATIRGFSGVDLLVIDEAARVPDDLYRAARPMLAVSGGRLVALSTPHGKRGWWYEAWVSKEAWERYLVPAEQCPRISPRFLAEERRSMGDWWWLQEYCCTFQEAETAAFRSEDVDSMFKPELERADWLFR